MQEFKDFAYLSDKAEENEEEKPQSWLTGLELEEDVEHEVPLETTTVDDTIQQETAPVTSHEKEEDQLAVELAEEAVWEDDKDWQICEQEKRRTVVVDDEVSFNFDMSDEEDTNPVMGILFLFIFPVLFFDM